MTMEIPEMYFKQIARLCGQMDRDYRRIAGQTGFQCRGCEDNCCRSLFYHHTFLEFYYLKKGLRSLAPDRRAAVGLRAARICESMEKAPAGGEQPRFMCPLNEDGRCLLYEFRPMICRLHGVAHSMRLPDGSLRKGPGCAAFEAGSSDPGNPVLDRTPVYQAMAALEQNLRRELGLTHKLKMTVARIICSADPV